MIFSFCSIHQAEDRAFIYVIADDAGKADDPQEVLTSRLLGTSTSELTSKLRERTGLDDVYVCARSWQDQNVFVPLHEEVPSMLECTHHLVVFNANSRGESTCFTKILSSLIFTGFP